MAYYIAVRSGVGYVVLPEHFGVRSNAERFARRRGWDGYFIATEEQRRAIEANQYLGNKAEEMPASISSAPDAIWMKEEGIPWDKNSKNSKAQAKNKAKKK